MISRRDSFSTYKQFVNEDNVTIADAKMRVIFKGDILIKIRVEYKTVVTTVHDMLLAQMINIGNQVRFVQYTIH